MNIQSSGNGNVADTDYSHICGCDTVGKLFAKRCQQYGDRTAHREKDHGIWKAYTWNDYYRHVQWISLALVSLGLKRGQVISILSEDNKEWLYFDMAATCAGAIASGIYTTDAAAQLAFLLNDSQTKYLIVENDEQLDKYLEVRDTVKTIEKVIVLEREGLRDFADDKVMFIDELYDLGQAQARANPEKFADMIAAGTQEEIRMLIYTSGTTGRPKGAMITNANSIFQLNSLYQVLESKQSDEALCFLPLCHVLERLFSVESQLAIGNVVNFAESPETVFENLQEVSPHVFVAVPRLWEKIFSRLQIMRKEATRFGRWAFDNALEAGMARAKYSMPGDPVPVLVQLRYRIWDFLVLANLRRMIGMGRLRRGATGAAPISPGLLEWFWAIGVPIFEGFGQTECSGVATINAPGRNKLGTIGFSLPQTETRISRNGEIQVRGPHVFKGYWGDREKTAEATTDDGWLKTGDIGKVDNEGYFTITGRIKDIIITAGGKNITPAEIESALKFSPYISDAVIIGDKRKYLTALVMIDQENVEKFAQDQQIPFSDFASLCAAPEVVELVQKQVSQVNKEFARVEQIKDFRLIDILLTAEDEELTPTMKLKRSYVEKRHNNLIDAMYGA